MLLTVKDQPIEIDTALEDGRRWAQVWFGDTCIGQFHSLEDAFAFTDDIIESRRWPQKAKPEYAPSVYGKNRA
jgi:hypothetical protein